MRFLRLMVALAVLAIPAIAEERPLSPGEEQPALELRQIDHDVAEAELAHKQGRMSSPDFRVFVVNSREKLQAAYSRVPPTPKNMMLYAALLRRLGAPDEALNVLNGGLERDPTNANLRLAVGQSLFEKRDFNGALSQAEAVLERDPQNKEALGLKYHSHQVIRLRGYRNRMTSQEQLEISSRRVDSEGLALAEKKHFEETKWFKSWSATP